MNRVLDAFRDVLDHVAACKSAKDVRLRLGPLVVCPQVTGVSDLAQILVYLHYRWKHHGTLEWQTAGDGMMQLRVQAVDGSLRWIDVDVVGVLPEPAPQPEAELIYQGFGPTHRRIRI